MTASNRFSNLQRTEDNPLEEVLLLADMVGKSKTTLAEVARDFVAIVKNPIVAGGFAMAHHGFVRATVDIDILVLESTQFMVDEFVRKGYKFESLQLPIGHLELLTKGNKGVDFIHLSHAAFLQSIEQRAVAGDFFGAPVRFVSLEDLIVLKSLALDGRTKAMDLADLENLIKLPHDAAYVELWKQKAKR